MLAAQTIPLVGFVLLGGVWSDRIPRRRVMVGSDCVRALAQGASAGLLLSGSAHVWELASLQAVYGAAAAFFGPAATGVVPLTVGPDDLQPANALMGLSLNLASVLGPAAAGVIVGTIGPGWGLAFDAGTFVGSAACLAGMRTAGTVDYAPRQTMIAELRTGWRAFRSRAWLWTTVVSSPSTPGSASRRCRSSGRRWPASRWAAECLGGDQRGARDRCPRRRGARAAAAAAPSAALRVRHLSGRPPRL